MLSEDFEEDFSICTTSDQEAVPLKGIPWHTISLSNIYLPECVLPNRLYPLPLRPKPSYLHTLKKDEEYDCFSVYSLPIYENIQKVTKNCQNVIQDTCNDSSNEKLVSVSFKDNSKAIPFDYRIDHNQNEDLLPISQRTVYSNGSLETSSSLVDVSYLYERISMSDDKKHNGNDNGKNSNTEHNDFYSSHSNENILENETLLSSSQNLTEAVPLDINCELSAKKVLGIENGVSYIKYLKKDSEINMDNHINQKHFVRKNSVPDDEYFRQEAVKLDMTFQQKSTDSHIMVQDKNAHSVGSVSNFQNFNSKEKCIENEKTTVLLQYQNVDASDINVQSNAPLRNSDLQSIESGNIYEDLDPDDIYLSDDMQEPHFQQSELPELLIAEYKQTKKTEFDNFVAAKPKHKKEKKKREPKIKKLQAFHDETPTVIESKRDLFLENILRQNDIREHCENSSFTQFPVLSKSRTNLNLCVASNFTDTFVEEVSIENNIYDKVQDLPVDDNNLTHFSNCSSEIIVLENIPIGTTQKDIKEIFDLYDCGSFSKITFMQKEKYLKAFIEMLQDSAIEWIVESLHNSQPFGASPALLKCYKLIKE